jgi:transcriptional regulator with XRE-family HTH domain
MTLGDYIKEYRIKHGYTQKYLAELLNVPGSDADICRLEKGTERTLDSLRSRFIVYAVCVEEYPIWSVKAKHILINVSDLTVFELSCLIKFI